MAQWRVAAEDVLCILDEAVPAEMPADSEHDVRHLHLSHHLGLCYNHGYHDIGHCTHGCDVAAAAADGDDDDHHHHDGSWSSHPVHCHHGDAMKKTKKMNSWNAAGSDGGGDGGDGGRQSPCCRRAVSPPNCCCCCGRGLEVGSSVGVGAGDYGSDDDGGDDVHSKAMAPRWPQPGD